MTESLLLVIAGMRDYIMPFLWYSLRAVFLFVALSFIFILLESYATVTESLFLVIAGMLVVFIMVTITK